MGEGGGHIQNKIICNTHTITHFWKRILSNRECVCRYTEHGGLVYASVLFWPEDGLVTLGSVTSTVDTQVTMLGYQGLLQVRYM